MTTLWELQVRSAERSVEQTRMELRAILEGPSGWALAGWLAGNLQRTQDKACSSSLANSPGTLAHAAGGVAAIRELQSQLAECLRGRVPAVTLRPGPEASEISTS